MQQGSLDHQHSSFDTTKPRNIFEHGRIYNHKWIPLNPDESKDINLVDDVGDWIRDKTILLVGDSVDRNTAQWFCEYKNWTLNYGSFPENDGWTDCKNYHGCSRVCHSKELNVTLINAFITGLNPDESLRGRTGDHYPNNQPMDPKRRLMEIYMPYIRNVLKREPNVVVFNSGYLFKY